MESEVWQVIGYKGNKGKKPRSMGKVYFGEMLDKDRALKAVQNIFCFSTITDVIATKWTRLDAVLEGLRDMRWLLASAILVIGGLVLGIRFGFVMPGLIMASIGLWYGVSSAPHLEF